MLQTVFFDQLFDAQLGIGQGILAGSGEFDAVFKLRQGFFESQLAGFHMADNFFQALQRFFEILQVIFVVGHIATLNRNRVIVMHREYQLNGRLELTPYLYTLLI